MHLGLLLAEELGGAVVRLTRGAESRRTSEEAQREPAQGDYKGGDSKRARELSVRT